MSLADDIIGGNYNPKKRKLADDIIKGTYKPTSVLDDIAPVKTTVTQPVEEKKDTGIFSKGAFSDGYDFGDVTKSILGTGLDVVTNTAKSLFGIGESAGDLINYGIAGVADLLGKKDFAENLKNEASKSLTNEIFAPAENLYDKTSLLGEFSDNLVQGVGYYAGLLGLQSVGVPWQVTSGVSSGGNEMSEAFQNGASVEEALVSSVLSAGAEIGSEYLFKGLKLPGTGKTSEALFGGMVDNIKNKALKSLAGFGINVVGEGLEEIISGWANNVAKNLTYMKDEDKNIFQNAIKGTTDYYSKNAWNDFIMGSLVTAITGGASPQTWNNIKTGRNMITGYTANEQSIIDQEVSNKMEEAEKNGKKLTNKEKSAIKEQVEEDLKRGYISTDTIESTLGGETYNQLQELKNKKQSIQDEITKLENMPNAEITVAENEKLQDLRNQIKEIDTKELETKLSDEVKAKIGNDNFLKQSYIERALKSEKFSYDTSKVTDENAKATYESAARVANNSNRSHEFVDKVAKLAEDRGTKYLFTNNEEIANGKYNIKGKTINGFIDENGNVLININSDKALNTILGHETTHLLEGTKEYKELQEAAIEYAKMKNDYQNRVDSLNELYKNVENADINNELTADIIGDYLFTDENFINNLSTKKPTLFTKIKNLIDDLVVRFKGTKEERQLRELQRKFEKVYRQNSTNIDSKYSITEKNDGSKYVNIDTDQNIFDGIEVKDYNKVAKMYITDYLMGNTRLTENDEAVIDSTGRNKYTNPGKHQKYFSEKMKLTPELQNVMEIAQKVDESPKIKENATYDNYEYYKFNFKLNNQMFEGLLNIGIDKDNNKHFYEVNKIKKVEGISSVSTNSPSTNNNNVPQNVQNVNGTYNNMSLAEQLEQQGTKILEEAENKRQAMIENFKEYLEENSITKPTQQDIDDSITDLLSYDNEQSAADNAKDEKLYNQYVREYMKENNIPFKDTKYSLSPSGEMLDNTTGEKVKLDVSNTGDTGTLMAIHNLNEDKMKGILELGGFPVPSIAITDPNKVNHSQFGNISVLFDKSTIDPAIEANEVYDRDIWSPTFPRVEYDINMDNIRKMSKENKIYDDYEDDIVSHVRTNYFYGDNLSDLVDRWGIDEALDKMKQDKELKYLYQKTKDNNYQPQMKPTEYSKEFSNETLQKYADFYNKNKFNGMSLPDFYYHYLNYGDMNLTEDETTALKNTVRDFAYKQYKQDAQEEYARKIKNNPEIQNSLSEEKYVDTVVDMMLESFDKSYFKYKDFIKDASRLDEFGETKSVDRDATLEKVNNEVNQKEFDEWVDNTFGKMLNNAKKGIRNDKEIFTASGNRRSFDKLHDEYNLENIVSYLTNKKTVAGEEGFGSGQNFGTFQAKLSNKFNSIEDIKNFEDRLQYNEETKDLLDNYSSQVYEYMNELNDYSYNKNRSYYYGDNAGYALNDFAGYKNHTLQNLNKALENNGINSKEVPEVLKNNIINTVNKLKNIPTDYFEAKPQRAVGLDEIQQVVIPNNVDSEFKQQLQDMNISYTEYDPNIEGDRQRVINQFDNLKFSLSNNNDIAPIGNYNVYGKDIKYQVEDAIAPLQETMYDLSNQVKQLQNDIAPVRTEVENNVPREKTERDIIAERILNDKVKKAIQNQSYKAVNMAAKKGQEFLNFDQAEKKQFKNELSKYIGKTREEIISAATWNDVKDIVSNYTNREIKYVDEELKSIKDEIRKRRIKVTDNLKNQITDYNDFRRSNFGKLKLGSEGNNIDSLYQELSNSYPYYFGEANTEADMLYELSDFMNQDITVTDKYKLTDEDIEDYTNKIFNLLKDNTMSSETIEELQNKLEKKINTRTREVIQQELLDDMGVTLDDIAQGKDISALDSFRTDPIRLNEKVFGYETGNKINDATIRKTKHNEAERIRWLNKERQEIKDLGIKAFSKESAAVQKYAEKEYVNYQGEVVPYGDMNLMREFKSAETREKIKHAAEVLRGKYDTYIDQINKTLTDMGYTPIAKRKDYMRHFQALNDIFSRFGTPLNKESMQSDALPTDINGLTDQFKPGKQYFANALKRLGMKTQYDAITGIDGYLDGASNLIYHTEDIQRYRALSKLIRNTYGQTHGFDDFANMTPEQQAERVEDIQSNKLSKYAAWLDEQANALAGKKGGIDRAAERILGRKIYNVLNTAKKQVGSNMTGYNVRSALTNFASAVQGASKTNKLAFIKGTLSTMNNIINHDGLIDKSDFLTSRFGSENLSQKLWQRLSNKGQIFMSGTDYFTANQIWRSKYYENLQKGMNETDAIKNADDFAARIMGDRSKGSTAEAFNSKTLGLLTQFQLEVNNQWSSLIHDNKIDVQNKNKTMSSMLFQTGQLFALSYLFNNFMKSLTGSKVMIDPVELFKKIFAPDDDDERTIEERAREAFGDIIDDLPFVSFFTGGGRIPVSEAFQGANSFLDYLTGQNNSYGQPVTFDDAVDDTIESAFYWLLPTGYGQAKKTVGGLSMFDENLPVKGSYTDSGRLRYPVEDTPTNRIQAGLFGKWANKNAQDYLNRKESALTEKQIDEFSKLDMPIQEYWDYSKGLKEARAEGKENGNQTEAIFEYINSLDATNEQKNIMINSNTNRKNEIDMSNYDDYGSYEEFDFATKNEEKYNYLEKNNISYKEYTSSDETKKAYDYAYNNRNKKDFNTKMTNYVNKLNLTSKDKKKILSKFGIKS